MTSFKRGRVAAKWKNTSDPSDSLPLITHFKREKQEQTLYSWCLRINPWGMTQMALQITRLFNKMTQKLQDICKWLKTTSRNAAFKPIKQKYYMCNARLYWCAECRERVKQGDSETASLVWLVLGNSLTVTQKRMQAHPCEDACLKVKIAHELPLSYLSLITINEVTQRCSS